MIDENKIIGQALKDFRRALKMSRKDMLEYAPAGVNENDIYRAEHGGKIVPVLMVMYMAYGFNINTLNSVLDQEISKSKI